MEKGNWSQIKNNIDDYIKPEYYNRLIKDYVFEGKKDGILFEDFLDKREFPNVLELGCGSGRSTDIFVKNSTYSRLTLVDLSKDMISFVKNKYKKDRKINYVYSDHLSYLQTSKSKYDLVYSLWSLSHSIHANFHRLGLKKGKHFISKVIKDFIINNLNTNASFYIIHFDSMSEEQTILLNQWRKVYPIFKNTKKQSPSKLLLDKIFLELDNDKKILYSCEHLLGERINYKDQTELLEVFMNFHLETFFNKEKSFEKVKESIIDLSKGYLSKNGEYNVRSGCYIYKITKL